MDDPIISVILPVFNGERYLRYCLDSLINQDFRSYEIVIVDDSSTDMTSTIIKEYEGRSKRIRSFICNKPKIRNVMVPGNNSARRMAIKNARGKYLMHFVCHSIAKRNLLSTLYSVMKDIEDNRVVCVGCKEVGLYETYIDKLIYIFWSIPRKFRLPYHSFIKRGVVFNLWKKSFIDDIGGFPKGGDTELNILVNRLRFKKFFTSKTWCWYIWRSSGRYKGEDASKNSIIAFFWKMVATGNCRAMYCKKYESSIHKYLLFSIISFPFGYGIGFLLGLFGIDANKSMGLI